MTGVKEKVQENKEMIKLLGLLGHNRCNYCLRAMGLFEVSQLQSTLRVLMTTYERIISTQK